MKKIFSNFKFVVVFFLLTALNACKKDFVAKTFPASSNDMLSLAAAKPNIVLILADDVGYEVPTVDGGQSYSTPNIDLMARSGIRFTQCYAAPMCSPSRFMLMTSKYNFRNYTIWGVMDRSQRSFANMLSDAGYDTYLAGKWQLDGGDQSVRAFGFNQSYIIFEPYEDMTTHHDKDPKTIGRYKSPDLYANGAPLPVGTTVNKYCDDILVDSLVTYAKRSASRQKPFLLYYTTSLCHQPYSPTPDDPEYAAWDPLLQKSDSTFYPSMVKYLDKKLGQLFRRLDSAGLAKNTIFIFVGDNGTPHAIYSMYKGQLVQGGKMQSTVWGTHVPLMVYWRGVVKPGLNSDLIDFTDFLPTLAGIANVPVPTTYGTLDGVSFYPRLKGLPGTPRSWVFCHYDPEQKGNPSVLKRWIQDTTYKLYDSTHYFYNTVRDPYEKTKLKDSQLTPEEKAKKAYFQSVMDTLHN